MRENKRTLKDWARKSNIQTIWVKESRNNKEMEKIIPLKSNLRKILRTEDHCQIKRVYQRSSKIYYYMNKIYSSKCIIVLNLRILESKKKS